MGQRLAAFLEFLYQRIASRSLGSETIFAVQHEWADARGHLPRSWRLYRSWNYITPSVFRRPWTVDLTLAMTALALITGRVECALSYVLLFHCLLRPGEVWNLTAEDIHLETDRKFYSRMIGIVAILRPKTRRLCARIQHVTVFSPAILEKLEDYVKDVDSSQLLLPSYS